MEFLAELHPLIVHFPIASLILYSLFEITGILIKREFVLKMAYVLLVIGIVTAVGAVLTGNQAAEAAVIYNAEWDNVIDKHEDYATITLWYFFAILVFRTYLTVKKKFSGIYKYVFIPLVVLGIFLIYETGVYGSKLVYEHGIGTKIIQIENNDNNHSNIEEE